MKLTYDEMIETATQLIEDKADFEVYGLSGRMISAVDFLEKLIEGKQLTCRIYTIGRSASVAAAIVSAPLAIASAVAIGAHNLATYDPDYEIGKQVVNHKLEVTYKKRAQVEAG